MNIAIVDSEPMNWGEMHKAHVARRNRLWPSKRAVFFKKAKIVAVMSAYSAPAPAHFADPAPDLLPPMASTLIVRQVLAKHQIKWSEMISDRRFASTVIARQELMWRLRDETKLSLPQIGRLLGHRDHTTVLHGVRKHQARIDNGTAR